MSKDKKAQSPEVLKPKMVVQSAEGPRWKDFAYLAPTSDRRAALREVARKAL